MTPRRKLKDRIGAALFALRVFRAQRSFRRALNRAAAELTQRSLFELPDAKKLLEIAHRERNDQLRESLLESAIEIRNRGTSSEKCLLWLEAMVPPRLRDWRRSQ